VILIGRYQLIKVHWLNGNTIIHIVKVQTVRGRVAIMNIDNDGDPQNRNADKNCDDNRAEVSVNPP
jgi:hypothetical protein